MPAMTSFEPQHTEFAAIVAASFAKQGLMQALGIELITVEAGLCELRAGWREDLGSSTATSTARWWAPCSTARAAMPPSA